MVPSWLLLVLKRWAMQRRVFCCLLLPLVLPVLAPLMVTVVVLTEVLVRRCWQVTSQLWRQAPMPLLSAAVVHRQLGLAFELNPAAQWAQAS